MSRQKIIFDYLDPFCRKGMPRHVAEMFKTTVVDINSEAHSELNILAFSLDDFLLCRVQGRGKIVMKAGDHSHYSNHSMLVVNASGAHKNTSQKTLFSFPRVGQIGLGMCSHLGVTTSTGNFSYLTAYLPNYFFKSLPYKIPYGRVFDGNFGPGAVVSATLLTLVEEVSKSGGLRPYKDMLPAFCEMIIPALTTETGTDNEPGNVMPKRVQKAINFIRANFSEVNLSAEIVADHVCISRRQLDRDFLLYGYSFNSYLRTFRLNMAKQFFQRDPEVRVSEVAYSVGFSSQSVFCRIFKLHFGLTPSEFISSEHQLK